ncbi:ABC transporter permease subunit [Trichocoleus desertorum AS-A10]|uniref:PhnE/PtxC family ABC transporter permease n=1 Tax=Trichocoleus desertorum TaxID=1481672 RepID=UPI00329B6997
MWPTRNRSFAKLSTKLPPRPSLFNPRTLWGAVCLAAIAWSVQQTGIFSRSPFNLGGWSLVGRFLEASLHPNLSPDFLWLTWHSTLTTLAYAVCGTSLSVAIGVIGGVLASEVWWQSVFLGKREAVRFQSWGKKPQRWSLANRDRWPWLSIRAVLSVPRAIHEIIWGLFFVNVFGLDPLTAVLAIALPFGAITAKVFSEILDETPRQPLLALLNSGVSPLQALTYGLIPQAFPNLLSYTFYRFECSIRSAAVLGIIGAGGLGYQILLSLQSLRYEQMWTLFLALFLLNGSVDFWSALLRHRLGLPNRLDLNTLNLTQRPSLFYQRDPVVIGSWLGVVLLLPFSFWYVQADVSKLWQPRTLQLLSEVFQTAWSPHLTGISSSQLWELATQTLAMSILAMAIAGVGGVLLSFPAAHNFFLPGGLLNPTKTNQAAKFWSPTGLLLTRFWLLVSRAIPAPIWALMWLFVLFPGILPGAIALGLHNLGILGRLMAEVNENLDRRPLKALKSQGAAGAQVFLYGVLPPTFPRFIAYILYRWEVCIRETVIVGLVGAGGLGRLLTEQLSSFDYPGLLVTLSCFIGLTFVVDLISATLRKALR